MPDLEDVRRLVTLEAGLATVATSRADGTMAATVVNGGVVADPRTDRPVVAFLGRAGTRKIDNLRQRPPATMTWRAGWAWVTVEGTAELVGPDDGTAGLSIEAFEALAREVYRCSGGGEHPDWAEFDRVVRAERRIAVLVHPARVYTNP